MAGVTDDTVQQIASLKAVDPNLKVFVSVGGWSFNDPGPTQTTFSTLAGSSSAQENFFASLISFMSTYNLDGVDIDWYVSAGRLGYAKTGDAHRSSNTARQIGSIPWLPIVVAPPTITQTIPSFYKSYVMP
jgi:GH18 family chitinase